MEVKKPISFKEQLVLIKNRGCVVENDDFAISVLNKVNYYKLTAYFLPFKNPDNTYKTNTTFNKVYMIFEFDLKLRNLCLLASEQIELMLRTQLSYYFSHKYGALGYLKKENFNSRCNFDEFLEHCKAMVKNNSRQLFVKHHVEKYEGNFPLWVLIELFSTGELSYFYSDMLTCDQKEIAINVFKQNYRDLKSWLMCLTYLRNYCAHYSRLYYTLFPAQPATPMNCVCHLNRKIFDYVFVLKLLYPKSSDWVTEFYTPLEALIEQYDEFIDLQHIGFSNNWRAYLK